MSLHTTLLSGDNTLNLGFYHHCSNTYLGDSIKFRVDFDEVKW
jgi:hypothetical protein